MEDVINPLLLYVGCGLGAVAVAMSLPRRGANFALFGGLLAALAGGLVVLGLGLKALGEEQLPNVLFYAFAAMALGSGVRMITHPRPVYSALYFILTIIASSGLYLLLSAEFMAFALIIIYAGAILITYLFVIMLATQAPSEEETDRLSEYDAVAREPLAASVIGFVLLAVLTTMLFRGVGNLPDPGKAMTSEAILAKLPLKWEGDLMDALREAEPPLVDEDAALALLDDGSAVLDFEDRTVLVVASTEQAQTVAVPAEIWDAVFDDSMRGTNTEALGLNLLGEHPMTIEIAGVILLMAMLGAVVLARKQIDLEEEAKRVQARRLHLEEGSS